jgi:hypothetical protein
MAAAHCCWSNKMADLRITELSALASADLAATDPLPVADLSASTSKKITAKDFVQKAVTLIDDASIPSAKVNFSGISGASITDGTVTAVKLNTSSIPATGGLAVSSGNLGLVAPTSPIVRNGSTGSLEHATSGATAGTYTKVTVNTLGHVTAGTSVAAADLPIAVSGTVGVMSPGTGLTVTGGGVLNHSSSITAGTTSGFTYNAQGHITGAVALAGADLPVATSSVIGGTRPGTGLTVDGNGILSISAATNSVLGGVIVGSDFAVSTGTISLATQGGLSAGQYTKITLNSKGVATAGTVLVAGDIPNLDASKITTGSLDIARVAANTITGAKIANYAISKIGDTTPTADCVGQFFFNPLSKDLFLYDGNVYQPIGISVGEIVFAGTFNASTGSGTGLITSVTAEGTAIGLTIGAALPAASVGNSRYYVVVSTGGTVTTGNAPRAALNPPDIILSNGTSWVEIDISQTFTTVTANQVSFTPFGSLASSNVQAAIEELDTEKLPLAGGTVTGNLEIGTAGSLSFEGSTANTFETFLSATDPTADRAIVFPDQNGTVIVSGNASIVNADINASAAIVDTKLATIVTAGKVSNSSTTAASAVVANAIVARDSSGNFSAGTITAALTGTASSATALATARTIQGVSFDGTANITVATAGSGISVTGTAIANTGVLSVNGNAGAITNIAATNAVQSFTVAQRGTVSALGAVSAGTTTLDLATANNFSLSLPAGGTVTLANPSNQTAGQSGVVTITQNSGTAATVAYGGNWKFQGGAPSVSTTLSSVNVIAYYVESSSRITAQLLTNTVS